MHWNYTKFTSEFMKISVKIFSLGRHILKSADKHPYHDDDEDMYIKTRSNRLNRFSNSLQKSMFKVGRKGDNGNTKGSAQDAMQLQRHQIQRLQNQTSLKPAAAVNQYRLCIFGIEDKMPCQNLHLIRHTRNIKISETTCNLCRTMWRWDSTALQQPETRKMDI